jgi:hypothetical protein
MKTVTVIADERPGLLSDISYILGKSRINIESFNVSVCGGKVVVALCVRNPKKAEEVLMGNNYLVNPSETLIVRQQGNGNAVHTVLEMLAKQRITIENIDTISGDGESCILAMNVDRPRKAVKVLGDILINRLF